MNDKPAILLVDDETDHNTMTMVTLAAAGWAVRLAEDGRTAIAAMQKGTYALVLMEIRIPGLDGFDTTRAIRANGSRGASVPILAFTAMPASEMMERARLAGMDGHIAKPFTPDSLLAAVMPWYPRGGTKPAAPLIAHFGEAEVANLLARLHEQLAEALRANDDPPCRADRAHKLAGISGALGFAEVSRTWLAVSEGNESVLEEARAAARRAMRTIDASRTLAAEDETWF